MNTDNENVVLSMVIKCRDYLVQAMEKYDNTQCSNTLTRCLVKSKEFCVITTISNHTKSNSCILGINVSESRHCMRLL